MSGALRVPPVSGTGRVSKQTATGSHGELTPPLNDNRRVSALKGQATRGPWQRRGFDPLENIKPYKGRARMKPLFRMDRACQGAFEQLWKASAWVRCGSKAWVRRMTARPAFDSMGASGRT